ncbi:MAG: YesL family protein [Lachnospiraceae bacterium]
MKFFSVDSPFYRFITKFWDLVQLNFFWLLCCLPIVTIGASTVAACSVALKMAEDTEGYIGKSFFKAFRENLKTGIPLGILALVAVYAVYLDFQFWKATEGLLFLVMGMIAVFVFALGFLYAFPLMARYENTLVNTLKNSYEISTRYFLRTLFTVFIVVLEILLFIWNTTLMLIGAFVGPAIVIYTVCAFSIRLFRLIEKESGMAE